MSDHRFTDPFSSPGPDASQWQGTPVPTSPVPTSPVPTSPVPTSPVPTSPVPTSPMVRRPQAVQVPPPPVPQDPAYGSPVYPPVPPSGYMYAANPTTNSSKNWMGITSLILSMLTPVLGITFIPGIILGHLGLSAAKRGEANNRGLALAGVIAGWIFAGFAVLFIAFIAWALSADPSTT